MQTREVNYDRSTEKNKGGGTLADARNLGKVDRETISRSLNRPGSTHFLKKVAKTQGI
jgi:Fic family protein